MPARGIICVQQEVCPQSILGDFQMSNSLLHCTQQVTLWDFGYAERFYNFQYRYNIYRKADGVCFKYRIKIKALYLVTESTGLKLCRHH